MKSVKERYQVKMITGSSHSWSLSHLKNINFEDTILDYGPGTGFLSDELKKQNCINIHAIEIDEKAKEELELKYLTIKENLKEMANVKFDHVFFLDVLEHTAQPEKILDTLISNHLKNKASIYISVPNTAHWSVRFYLLFTGKFNHFDRGILDKTHLQFYTKSSLKKFLKEIKNVSVDSIDYSIEPYNFIFPEKIYNSKIFQKLLKVRIKLGNILPSFFAYQFLIKLTYNEDS